jgi:citrate lyase subunit beta/citryl-CoA lyase
MRSKLFVPGSRPELFAKALASQADALSFDLEDSVDESRKDHARRELSQFLRSLPPSSGKTIIVRVNGLTTPHFQADIEAVAGPNLDIVNLPKSESPGDERTCAGALENVDRDRQLEPIAILPTIESPKALRLAAEIAAASPRVVGLQVGWADLIEPLGIDRYNPAPIQAIQLQIRIAAGEAGVWAYDGAWANIGAPDGYRREAEAARRLGYLGKSAIHPTQVPIANDVFRPTDEEIAHAVEVVKAARQAAEEGRGAFTVGGRMVDAPFIRRAEAILAVANRLNLVGPEQLTRS